MLLSSACGEFRRLGADVRLRGQGGPGEEEGCTTSGRGGGGGGEGRGRRLTDAGIGTGRYPDFCGAWQVVTNTPAGLGTPGSLKASSRHRLIDRGRKARFPETWLGCVPACLQLDKVHRLWDKKKSRSGREVIFMEAESLPSYEMVDGAAERMDTPYDAWAASQGIDVVKGYGVANVYELPLKWGERMGGYGVFINLQGTGYLDDAYVCSIQPGKSLNPQRHLFEELVYVLDGRGATTVWQGNGAEQSFEGPKGRLVAEPLIE